MADFMKVRQMPAAGPRSFGQQGRKASKAGGGGGFRGPIEGEYSSFWPHLDKSIWFAMCPDQAWTNEVWDREQQKVIKSENQYFFSYVKHRIAKTGRNFYCSAGAHKTQPCWGCGIRNAHFEQQRDIQERTGVRPKGEPPLSAGLQYAMSGVILENIAKMPVLDNQGKQRMSKQGKPILRDTPLTLLKPPEQQAAKKAGATSFGLSVHYSFGTTTLNELLAFDDALKNSCANCADDLQAVNAYCPECAEEYQIAEDPESPLTKQDLKEARAVDHKCTACDYYGPLVPLVMCLCGDPKEGALVDFALRLQNEVTGEKSRSVRLVEIKPIGYFKTKYPAIEEMLAKPLDLPKIFAPSAMQLQNSLIPAEYRGDGVTPEPRKTKGAAPATESYSFGGGGDKEESTDEADVPY